MRPKAHDLFDMCIFYTKFEKSWIYWSILKFGTLPFFQCWNKGDNKRGCLTIVNSAYQKTSCMPFLPKESRTRRSNCVQKPPFCESPVTMPSPVWVALISCHWHQISEQCQCYQDLSNPQQISGLHCQRVWNIRFDVNCQDSQLDHR